MQLRPEVAIVATGLDILGGQCVQARSLVVALQHDGVPVTFLAINPRFPSGLRWLRRIRYLRTVVNQLMYLPGLTRLALADVVHIFSGSYWSFLLAPVPAMIAARAFGKRVILHYHSGEAEDHLTNWGLLVHPWLRLAHEIVVPSEYLHRVFANHGYDARVISNVVDLSRFSFRDRRPLRPRLLSARNLEPYYRVDLILEAFARFKKMEPAATLTVAGTGSEEGRLRRLAQGLHLEAVRFVGPVEPEEMPALYAEHDIFVNASVVDNQPVSILEAFAAGLPVVSTATGDIPFMVTHRETGLLTPSADAEALGRAIAEIWRFPDEAREMARRARGEVANYTWSAVRDRWADIYTDKTGFYEVAGSNEPS
jgi:L-malate glycosyltransferase